MPCRRDKVTECCRRRGIVMGNARMPVSLHRLSHDAIMVSWSQEACATCELTYCACLSPNRPDAVSTRPIDVTTRLESSPCVPSLGLADVLSPRRGLVRTVLSP